MRDRCKILDVSRAASTTETVAAAAAAAAAEAGAEAEQTSLPCHKCRNCLHISLVIASAWWRRRRSRGERPPLLCTSAAHTHTRMYIFAFFVLLGSFGKRYKHSPTYTHSHTDNDVVAQPARASAAARERVREQERQRRRWQRSKRRTSEFKTTKYV